MGFLKKITRPISRVLDKIVPNEIKPALPFLAAAAPFMAPGIMGIGGNTMLSRALISGGLNLGSQLAQEGSEGDFNALSLALASGIGALSGGGPGKAIGMDSGAAGDTIVRSDATGASKFFADKAASMPPGLTKSGLGALESSANYLSGVGETLRNNPFSIEGLKAAMVPVGQATTDLAIADTRRLNKQQIIDDALGALDDAADSAARASAIRLAMQQYGFTEDEITETISSAGYRAGGRVGLSNGGDLEYGTKEYFKKSLDDVGFDELIENPNLLMPFTIGMIEDRLNNYATVGGDISPYLEKYEIIKQKNAEYFQGLSEEDKKDYTQRNKDQLQGDVEMGIFPGQDKLGIESLEIETDSGIKIPSPKKDIFDIEGFKKYRMDAATGGRIGLRMGGDPDFSGIKGAVESVDKNMKADRAGDFFRLRDEAIQKGDSDKIKEIESDFFREFGMVMPKMAKDGGRINFDNGGFEPFKYTSKIPKVFKEDPFGSDPLGQILNMSYTVRAPLIDIIRTVAKTATEATKLAAAAVKLGYDVTEPVREVVGDIAGGIYDVGKDLVKGSKTDTRFLQPTYYLERYGPALFDKKTLTDEETQLKMMSDSVGRDDPKKRRELENIVFGFDDAGMSQRPEDKEVSETIKFKEKYNFADGGLMNLGGKEMDMRGGGFIPIGKKERADDVPARLSKNEFVMTADAVRAAGGGSVNKGAKRMYDLMNNLEARV